MCLKIKFQDSYRRNIDYLRKCGIIPQIKDIVCYDRLLSKDGKIKNYSICICLRKSYKEEVIKKLSSSYYKEATKLLVDNAKTIINVLNN